MGIQKHQLYLVSLENRVYFHVNGNSQIEPMDLYVCLEDCVHAYLYIFNQDSLCRFHQAYSRSKEQLGFNFYTLYSDATPFTLEVYRFDFNTQRQMVEGQVSLILIFAMTGVCDAPGWLLI